MFKSVWRLFRAFGYLITGRIDKARQALSYNPAVIGATYDANIQHRKNNINEYSNAIASLVAIKEEKSDRLKTAYKKAEELEQMKKGALVKVQQASVKYASIADADAKTAAIKADPEYLKWKGKYDSYNTDLKKQEETIAELEAAIKTSDANVAQHRRNIDAQLSELKKIKDEKADTIADVISAKEEEKAAKLVAGLSLDTRDQELDEMREFRRKARAGASQAREMAGIASSDTDAEALAAAKSSASDDEFDKLLGLTKEAAPVATAVEEPVERARIPEA